MLVLTKKREENFSSDDLPFIADNNHPLINHTPLGPYGPLPQGGDIHFLKQEVCDNKSQNLTTQPPLMTTVFVFCQYPHQLL